MTDLAVQELMDAAQNGWTPALKALGEYAASPNATGLTRLFAYKCFVMAAYLGDEQAYERGADFLDELPPFIVDAVFDEIEDWICQKIDEEPGESQQRWSAELLKIRFPQFEVH